MGNTLLRIQHGLDMDCSCNGQYDGYLTFQQILLWVIYGNGYYEWSIAVKWCLMYEWNNNRCKFMSKTYERIQFILYDYHKGTYD